MKRSKLKRFFVLPESIEDNRIRISGTDVKHIKTVLRLRKDDSIFVFDGTGKVYKATIETLGDTVDCAIRETSEIKGSKCEYSQIFIYKLTMVNTLV